MSPRPVLTFVADLTENIDSVGITAKFDKLQSRDIVNMEHR